MFSKSLRAIESFDRWLGELPYRYMLAVPGNHELYLAPDERRRDLTPNATLLVNEGIEIDGLHFMAARSG